MSSEELQHHLTILEFNPHMRKNAKKNAVQPLIDKAVENLLAGKRWDA